MNIVDESTGQDRYVALLTAPQGRNIDGRHEIEISAPKEIGKNQFWCNVIDLVEEYGKRIESCSKNQCEEWHKNHCKYWKPEATEKGIERLKVVNDFRPDATRFNPDPAYIRALINKTGLTLSGCAHTIGVPAATLEEYTKRSSRNKYKYPVQFALECIIRVNEFQ